jgi:uncharacterized protein
LYNLQGLTNGRTRVNNGENYKLINNFMQKTAHWLLIAGGLNWLLAGLFGNDLFGLLSMDTAGWLPRLVYILVGLSALWALKPKSSAPVAPQM